MPYFLLAIGIALIVFSIKLKQNNEETTNSEAVTFENVLKKNIKEKEPSSIAEKNELLELNSRLESIEYSMLLLQSSLKHEDDTTLTVEKENEAYASAEDMEAPNTAEKEAEGQTVNEMIYSLYDSGTDIEEICKSLNLGKGEVLLRLGIRKSKGM